MAPGPGSPALRRGCNGLADGFRVRDLPAPRCAHHAALRRAPPVHAAARGRPARATRGVHSRTPLPRVRGGCRGRGQARGRAARRRVLGAARRRRVQPRAVLRAASPPGCGALRRGARSGRGGAVQDPRRDRVRAARAAHQPAGDARRAGGPAPRPAPVGSLGALLRSHLRARNYGQRDRPDLAGHGPAHRGRAVDDTRGRRVPHLHHGSPAARGGHDLGGLGHRLPRVRVGLRAAPGSSAAARQRASSTRPSAGWRWSTRFWTSSGPA